MGTVASGSIDLKSLKTAGEEVNKYITVINENGIKVHPENNTTDYIQIDSDSLDIYSGGEEVASYGLTSRVGKSSESHIDISSNSISAISSSGNEYFNVSENGGSYEDRVYTKCLSVSVSGSSNNYYSFGGDGASKWNSLSSGDFFDIRFTPTFEYTEGGRKKYITLQEITTAEGRKGTAKDLLSWVYGNTQVLKIAYTGATTASNVVRLTIAPTTTVSGVTYTLKQLLIYLGTDETIIAPFYKFGTDMPETGGAFSFLMGKGTIAPYAFQVAIGQYNDCDQGADTIFMVGNGTSDVSTDRSNALSVSSSGITQIKGANGEVQIRPAGAGTELGIDFYGTAANSSFYVGFGSGGGNHGIYSNKASKWIVYSNGTNVGLGGTIFKDLFVLETHTYKSNNLSITSGSALNDTLNITKAGYIPVAISGWRGSNGDNGSGGSHINPFTLRLSTSSVGSGTVQIGISAVNGAITNCSFWVDVLWIKNI